MKNGNFLAQIHEYAKGLNVLSSFLVVVGFDSEDINIMKIIDTAINEFRAKSNDFYIQAIYVDASAKQSASKISIKNIK